MFSNTSHLPQLLSADYYTDKQIYDRELDAIFLKGWHPIGTMADLPKEGSYFTTERFDRPLICWREDGKVQTYLNVCCHRHCTLTDKITGLSRDRLRCQYHGWEYDQTGTPRKIPDAPSFKPLKKGQFKLTTFRTEVVGQLIFMTFDAEAPSLEEYMGPTHYKLMSEWFNEERRPTRSFDQYFNCNWKVIIENVLESYHIIMLHPKTFGIYPNAEDCTHNFFGYGDECIMSYESGGRRKAETKAISGLAGVPPEYSWHHLIRYPNMIIANSCLTSYIQASIPMGVDRTCNFFRVFHHPGTAGFLRREISSLLLKNIGGHLVNRVLNEDASVYEGLQRGISSPQRPCEGLISVREERITPFQEYVLSMVGVGQVDGQPNERCQSDSSCNSSGRCSETEPIQSDYQKTI